MPKNLSVQEMIFDLWKCLEIDPTTGEKYLRVIQERDPVPPVPPTPEPEEPGGSEQEPNEDE